MRAPTLAACLAALACAAAGGPADPWAIAVLPSGEEVVLEIAADAESRARGYMFRDRVGRNEGMIFVFPTVERRSFWMKNCRVALDILWLDEALRVVHIAPDQQPCPAEGACPSIVPMRPARYALEFAAGTAAREGIAIGDRIEVTAQPPLSAYAP